MVDSTQWSDSGVTGRTRLAPSPTGALHLGNARTFLVNWAIARQWGWRIVLRIDDLDGPRIKRNADQQAIEILRWLGVDWDEGPYYQSDARDEYRAALHHLALQGAIYPCHCTRSGIQSAAASAPHVGQHELRYSGRCRPENIVPVLPDVWDQADAAWRFRVEKGELSVDDHFAGFYRGDVWSSVGDFLVANKQGEPSYQLAVVLDDVRQRVNRVVRGDDLLSSTPRQMLLYDALQLSPTPQYWHLPLVVGVDGRRLAKRHGDSRLIHYRNRGVKATRVVGLLAEWCGVSRRTDMSSREFLDRFDINRMPRQRVVYSSADDRWLMEGR